jgi:hypothetical protein
MLRVVSFQYTYQGWREREERRGVGMGRDGRWGRANRENMLKIQF